MKQSNEYVIERAPGVWTFVIDRPKHRNALTWEIRYALLQTLMDAERDAACNVLIITGAGDRAFCAGGDVSHLAEELRSFDETWPAEAMGKIRDCGEIARKIITSPVVVVSAVNGAAFGGGCFLALAADIVVAHKRAQFGFGFSKRGLVTDWGGSFILPRLVGMAMAKNLVLRGITLDADSAHRMGMIAEVAEDDALARARTIAAEIAEGPAIALGMGKQLLSHSFDSGLDTMLAFETFAQTLARRTADHREGMVSFLERRTPRFKGR